jgi:hypothetical protein
MPAVVTVPVPYDLEENELHLDPSSKVYCNKLPIRALLIWLLETGATDEEFERIFRASVVLWARMQHLAPIVTFAECFDTAVVWERG